jgi:hypothetical protein
VHAARSATTLLFGALLLGTVVGVMCCVGLPAAASASPDAGEVLLSDVGSGFVLVGEDPGTLGSLTRRFEHERAELELRIFPVTTPPSPRVMFDFLSPEDVGLTSIPEPSLDLAKWAVAEGRQVGADGSASLIFASRDHLFWFTVLTDGSAAIDGPAFVLDLAERQVAAAGGPPAPPDTSRDNSREDELVALLPIEPPPGYGLDSSATATGSDELEGTDDVQSDVADFLNKNSATAARVWVGDFGELAGAVSLTRHPYDIFAAAQLGIVINSDDSVVRSTNALPDVRAVVAYTHVDPDTGVEQISMAFRRGDYFVMVMTNRVESVPAERAAALAADLTRLVASSVPNGDTGPYSFPGTPSKVVGLGLSAGIVTAVAGGSAAIARIRARRVRRGWTGGELPAPTAGAGPARGVAIALDADAKRLRRQGAVVAGGQLTAVNISIVALAGDFAWTGIAVAVAAFLAGLAVTRWWQRRELGLLGAKGPPREFVRPRAAGVVVGVFALAVLGAGVGFAFKGLRYLVFPPTLAQLKWADLFGVAPRTVGIIFTTGGFAAAVIGCWVFRIARALGRAGTKRVLAADHRRSALYLRSFDDDSLPLPTIASARRPLFELFSIRGADPFEESVAWELNSYGPVVAVGRPGRSLASLGAAREHLADETWREQVANRMEEAGIIAVATGETDGLAWELGQVVSGGHLAKTFFVFPPVAPEALDRRWSHTAASLAEHGLAVGPLPVPPSLIHTVRLAGDGTASVTYATRRDEATYRTAVDHALDIDPIDATTHDAMQPPTAPATGRPA